MAQPLAERMRPKTLDDYIGQKQLVGEGTILRRMIDTGHFHTRSCQAATSFTFNFPDGLSPVGAPFSTCSK